MNHHVSLSLTLLLAIPLLLASCGDDEGSLAPLDGPVSEESAPGQVSKRLCAEYRRCGCGNLAGVSLSGCEQGMQFAYQATIEDAQTEGLTYDGECMSRRLNAMLERGCESTTGVFPG